LADIVTMKRLYIIFILISLIQCSTKTDSLNGRYVSAIKYLDGRYETLDIVDSLVLVDRIVLGAHERDTIFIDPETKKFVRVNSKSMFPIFDFKTVGDTIEIHYEHDLGQGKNKFVKAP
jgi:hypothetical protein